MLAVQGTISGIDQTERLLTTAGLAVSVTARRVLPMTELLGQRANTLTGLGRWGPEDGTYELAVVRAERP